MLSGKISLEYQMILLSFPIETLYTVSSKPRDAFLLGLLLKLVIRNLVQNLVSKSDFLGL